MNKIDDSEADTFLERMAPFTGKAEKSRSLLLKLS